MALAILTTLTSSSWHQVGIAAISTIIAGMIVAATFLAMNTPLR